MTLLSSSCIESGTAHGYGMEVVKTIMDAYGSAETMEEFVSDAYGCGMTVVELEWFWELSWSL